jgi:membrane protein required for colicin V production
MNILDIIILICLVPSLIQGLRKGFISQAISIISLVAGIWASAKFADLVGGWLAQYITASEQVLKLVSFALVMVVVFILLGLIGKLLDGIINLVMLGWMNRLLGAAFAVAKAILILGLLMIVFNSINANFNLVDPKVIEESVLYPILKEISDTVFPYLKSLMTLK